MKKANIWVIVALFVGALIVIFYMAKRKAITINGAAGNGSNGNGQQKPIPPGGQGDIPGGGSSIIKPRLIITPPLAGKTRTMPPMDDSIKQGENQLENTIERAIDFNKQ